MNIYEINNKKQFSFPCIYLWRNLVNNKIYVGQTQNFYQRVCQYKRGNDNHRVIGKALLKYGFDNFDISILEKVEIQNLDEREQYWLDYYKSYDSQIGYNVCKEAGTTRGFQHSENSKKQMSESRKEMFKNHPEKIKRGKDNPMFGKTMSEENRQKLIQRNIGNQYAKGCHWTPTEEFKEQCRQRMLGKQYCLGRKLSQETKDKIAKGNRGKVVSEETKKKQSESHKGKTVRKVKCVETDIVYQSITEASKAVNRDSSSISKCCRGKQATVAGYHWIYVD